LLGFGTSFETFCMRSTSATAASCAMFATSARVRTASPLAAKRVVRGASQRAASPAPATRCVMQNGQIMSSPTARRSPVPRGSLFTSPRPAGPCSSANGWRRKEVTRSRVSVRRSASWIRCSTVEPVAETAMPVLACSLTVPVVRAKGLPDASSAPRMTEEMRPASRPKEAITNSSPAKRATSDCRRTSRLSRRALSQR
jgi:hypothetical protein